MIESPRTYLVETTKRSTPGALVVAECAEVPWRHPAGRPQGGIDWTVLGVSILNKEWTTDVEGAWVDLLGALSAILQGDSPAQAFVIDVGWVTFSRIDGTKKVRIQGPALPQNGPHRAEAVVGVRVLAPVLISVASAFVKTLRGRGWGGESLNDSVKNAGNAFETWSRV